ncbi:MAG: GNAT family N-acetyltransferase [Ruminococcus flavefaciens]|nr:GNAT family N-acetyltransferase [Ruminococcus flavefaciens]MCM1229633.1 GNAT family N-acetyltransferase [Ruminococcus flavefaciens]
MIKLIQNDSELDTDMLMKSLSGKKMIAYMKAYGAGYDFCRFYKITDETGEGFMFIINSTLIICTDGFLQATDELQFFVNMNLPFRVEGDSRILRQIHLDEHYQVLNRTIFELIPDEKSQDFSEESVDFNPNLPEVYTILSEGFPNIADFSLWYTDTSHRCRHGISRVFTYRDCTTASLIFDIGDEVLIGQVATKVSARGSGYAREFLKWLAYFLNNLGKRAFLLALDIRVSFYREIGFREIETEIVLERTDVDKDNINKGEL